MFVSQIRAQCVQSGIHVLSLIQDHQMMDITMYMYVYLPQDKFMFKNSGAIKLV